MSLLYLIAVHEGPVCGVEVDNMVLAVFVADFCVVATGLSVNHLNTVLGRSTDLESGIADGMSFAVVVHDGANSGRYRCQLIINDEWFRCGDHQWRWKFC